MKVICTLPNASELISGVKFKYVPDVGMVSEEIDDDTAEIFLSIAGYEPADEDELTKPVVVKKEATTKPAAAPKAPTKAELAAKAKADKEAADKAEAEAEALAKVEADAKAEKEAADKAAAAETNSENDPAKTGSGSEETF